jgi:hypothetical protein
MAKTVTIRIKTTPSPKIHPNVQAWADELTSQHLLGQTSLQQAKKIVIDSDSTSATLAPDLSNPGDFIVSLS